jgi:hypothetical protein
MDVLVSGIVSAPLDAFGGRGRVQDRFLPDKPPAGSFEWPPTDVMQLYVPGLAKQADKGAPVERSSVGRQAIQQEHHEFIRSEEFR